MYFAYGQTETDYLKAKDSRLAAVIDRLGHINRTVDTNLFSSVVHHIIGQQISTRAHETIWQKLLTHFGTITPAAIASIPREELQRFGITFRKADYIQSAARKIISGEFDIKELHGMADAEVCNRLSALDGIGIWTAEMMMLHSLQRPDILSFGDLAMQRGLRMLYHHRKITRKLFEKYRRRYSPYGSVACIYLWAVSAGAVEGLKDYAPQEKASNKRKKR